jgi:hypothetical protein
METKGIEIVGMNVQQLLDLLNKAFADEWFAITNTGLARRW